MKIMKIKTMLLMIKKKLIRWDIKNIKYLLFKYEEYK